MKIRYGVIAAMMLLLPVGIVARSRDKGGEMEVSSWRKFDKLTDKYRYAVVMFYYRNKEMRKKGELKEEVDELKRMFRAVSREERYQDAHVAFLRIGFAKHFLHFRKRTFSQNRTHNCKCF